MSANGYVTQECVCACVCVPVCVHPTRCVIRHVVTRGDEESRPRNPLPCVHEEIPKEALKCTRTHTLVLSPPQQAPAALASLPFGPPEDSKKVGADRVRVLLLSGAPGLHWNLHPWSWERTGSTLLHPPIVEEYASSRPTQKEEETGNTQRGEMKLISLVWKGGLVLMPLWILRWWRSTMRKLCYNYLHL